MLVKRFKTFVAITGGVFVEIFLFLELIFLFLELKGTEFVLVFFEQKFQAFGDTVGDIGKVLVFFSKFLAYKTHFFKRLQAQALFFNTSIQFLFFGKRKYFLVCLFPSLLMSWCYFFTFWRHFSLCSHNQPLIFPGFFSFFSIKSLLINHDFFFKNINHTNSFAMNFLSYNHM